MFIRHKIKNIALFIAFWCITVFFYYETRGGGLVTDSLGWFMNYDSAGWRGLPVAFNDKALHYVYHLVYFPLYKAFHFWGWGWLLVYSFLHALNAALAYCLFNRILKPVMPADYKMIACIGSLLFLVSPYQTEPVVWSACIHYLVAVALLLSAFLLLLKYCQSPELRLVWLFYACFLLALLSLEIALAFPLMLLVFILFWHPGILFAQTRMALLKIFVLPLFVLAGAYFMMNKLLLGSWVGHYGAAAHLNFDMALLSSNFNKYAAKFFWYSQFLPYKYRHCLYQIFEQRQVALLTLAFYTCITAPVLFDVIKTRQERKAMAVIFLLFALALSPILNLYFSYLLNTEGDRMSYFASIFAYPLMIMAVFSFLPKIKYLLAGTLVLLSIRFLMVNTESWKYAAAISSALVEKFNRTDASHVYILNLPDNFRGVYMFRKFGAESALSEHLLLRRKIDLRGKITEVVNYNMMTPDDSVRVVAESDRKIKLEFAQWGNWFWNNGIGAMNYRNDDYSFEMDAWGHAYTLTFHSVPDSGSVILFQCGSEWRELKLPLSR